MFAPTSEQKHGRPVHFGGGGAGSSSRALQCGGFVVSGAARLGADSPLIAERRVIMAGRPRTISSPEEFEDRVDAFFGECEAKNQPATVTGLALFCGLWGRDALTEYERRPEFSAAVKRARSRVEACYEARLSGNAPAGAIFALKNMGWSDKQDLAVTGELGIRRIERVIRDA